MYVNCFLCSICRLQVYKLRAVLSSQNVKTLYCKIDVNAMSSVVFVEVCCCCHCKMPLPTVKQEMYVKY